LASLHGVAGFITFANIHAFTVLTVLCCFHSCFFVVSGHAIVVILVAGVINVACVPSVAGVPAVAGILYVFSQLLASPAIAGVPGMVVFACFRSSLCFSPALPCKNDSGVCAGMLCKKR
jgi:hypothetical protein